MRSEKATAIVIVTFFIVALFGFAALSIDVCRVFQQQRAINVATDMGSYAGAALLTNTPQSATAIRAEASAVTLANGVTEGEIAAAALNGLPGGILLGRWNPTTRVFTPDATPYNAVRVPAQRPVEMMFARVVGLRFMTARTYSISALSPSGSVNDAIPFGISLAELAGKSFGDTLILNDAGIGSGKWGKLELRTYQNTGAWRADMTTNGCGCVVSVGPTPTIQGNAQVRQAWAQIPIGSIIIMPVADEFDFSGGSGTANIVGFVVVQLISHSGTGNNWTGEVRFLDRLAGSGGGGLCDEPCIRTRVLVE